MSLSGPWVPQNDTEDRLMEDIHIATRRAHSDGMPKKRIAALLAFMASAALDPASDVEREEASEALANAMQEDPECPECGDEITGHLSEMGGPITLRPCDHEISVEKADEIGVINLTTRE